MKYTVKKHLTKALSIVMVLILLTCSLSACGDANGSNPETTPSVNVGSDPQAEMEEQWLEAETAINNLYLADGFTKDTLEVIRMASFGDAYVGMVRTGEEYDVSYETVGGLDFVYNYKVTDGYRDTKPIDVYYKGECYKLAEAFENGIINSDNLLELFNKLRYVSDPEIRWYEDYPYENWCILMCILPSYSKLTYILEDFKDLGCISVYNERSGIDNGLGSKYVVLEFGKEKEGSITEIVKKIAERSDIWYICVSNSGFGFAD